VVNVATGLAATEPELQDVMKTLRHENGDPLECRPAVNDAVFLRLLKAAATLAFVGTVISETVASNRGIGNLMMIASSSFDVPLVFAGLFILAALGVALYVVFSLIEGRSPAGRCAATILRPAVSSARECWPANDVSRQPAEPARFGERPLQPGAHQGQIGHAGRQQRDGQRDVHALAGSLQDRCHGARNIGRF
jgi:hypothetical protein